MLLNKDNITLINLLTLQQAFGAGSYKAVSIYEALKSNNSLDIPVKDIKWPVSIEPKDIKRIKAVNASKIYKIIDESVKNNISMLTIEDNEYPDRLRNISEPPIVLYIKGEFPDIDNEPIICIVGPRKVSDFGKKAAYSLSRRLAKSGIIIVSGGALGTDTSAHKGALSCGGRTIAVLGCGICYNYLPENRKLREAVADSCCVVSEHPPYAPTTKYCFPIRNRLMSALALGTAIIEADEKSGALITARYANEQGRDVFVIPGNPTYPQYKGSNNLLRDGALPLIDASDIFNQYIVQYAEKIDIKKAFEKEKKKNQKPKNEKKLSLGLSKESEMVYNNLNKQKFSADDLLSLGISDDKLISALTELEIEHVIRALPGGMYELIK